MAQLAIKPKPKKQTEIIVDENTIADVIETNNKLGKSTTIKYQAQVKQNETNDFDDEINNETENQDADSENQNGVFSFLQSDYQEIPKDKIDTIFDELELESKENDYFYAKLTRIPDSMSDNFFSTCASEMPLGVFQFTLRDRFNFIPAIQKQNNNSGGRFNIAIFDNQQKLMQYFVGYDNPYSARKNPVYKSIGAINVLIPNPVKIEEKNAQTENYSIVQIIAQMQQKSDERMERLLLSLREKSPFEKAMEQKLMNDIINPPQNSNNSLEEKFMALMMMPQVADRMAKKMFPEPVPVPETAQPDWTDKIVKIASLPMVQNALERVGDIGEAIIASNLAKNGQVQQPIEQPQQNFVQELPQAGNENNDMQVIITELITEIESNNEINSDNLTLQRLSNDYAEHFETVQTFCKVADFPTVLNMLITQTSKLEPFPFAPFLDLEQTNKTNTFVWNERGLKALKRLEQVHLYLKEN